MRHPRREGLPGGAREVAGKLGTITALVNNAAHDERHKLEDVTPEFWDDRIAVNLRHAFFAIQAVVPGMKQAGGGSIVNFSSISYHTMTANLSVYQAAKAATIGHDSRPGARSRQRQDPAQCDHAGLDHDPAPDRSLADAEAEADLMKAQVLKEKVYPPDIARMALFLASDDSRLISAQNFVVDGGGCEQRSASWPARPSARGCTR
jgi:NAD(P)-dependent dehydrogenase (short-subunit alcohol dehydrogenase family)